MGRCGKAMGKLWENIEELLENYGEIYIDLWDNYGNM